MTYDLDLTAQLGATLRALDTLIEGKLRRQIAEAVDVARRMLATSREPFGWRFIDLGGRELPDGVRSGAVFVLPAGTTPPGHHHPNSIQHMRVLAGRAVVTLRNKERTVQHDEVRLGNERPWLVIPRGVVHQIEVVPEGELVVLSFHTVPEEDLLEVSAAGARTYTDPAEAHDSVRPRRRRRRPGSSQGGGVVGAGRSASRGRLGRRHSPHRSG
jgi:quercetin dioxygenase-like cupin family protein